MNVSILKHQLAQDKALMKHSREWQMLLKRENAKTLKEIPAEIRYAYYDEQRKKYLKEHFYIKKVKVGYTEEEQEEMKQRLHKEMAKRRRQGKKVRI